MAQRYAIASLAGEPPGTQRRLAARLERHGERADHARLYRGVRLLRVCEAGGFA